MKDGSAMYVFCHWSKWHLLYSATEEAGFSIKNMIVLSKSNHGMGDLKGSYAPRHELILLATKGRHELRFPSGRSDDIWNVPVKFSGSKRFHPNEKPLSWLMPAIMNSSDKDQLVVDPFMGSGTTGIVAVGMGRKFIGCDVDETYYETSVKRVSESFRHKQNEIL
jgi:DNA modification methylase